jgi:hypothetical protein
VRNVLARSARYRHDGNVTGLDRSQGIWRWPGGWRPASRFCRTLPFADHSFDRVFSQFR